jgi:hypothetical protein
MFPTERDPVRGITLENFNYTPVITTLFISFILIFWNLKAPYGAKHYFKGPKISNEETPINKRGSEVSKLIDGYSEGQL